MGHNLNEEEIKSSYRDCRKVCKRYENAAKCRLVLEAILWTAFIADCSSCSIDFLKAHLRILMPKQLL
ncbi:MAG TPA: hypothetical protein VGC89_19805, partial [Pyrinomonadaceae bacterium]